MQKNVIGGGGPISIDGNYVKGSSHTSSYSHIQFENIDFNEDYVMYICTFYYMLHFKPNTSFKTKPTASFMAIRE